MTNKQLRTAVTTALMMACAAALSAGSAGAAEIKLIASPGVRAALNELAPQFEKTTGHKVVMDFAVIAVLKRRIEAGEAFDVVIPGPELIDELVRQGKVAADTRAAFGRTGVGLAVRKGAPRPDISTPENLKRALLAAKAVSHSKEGQSGVHFREALNRLGIAEEMRLKLKAYDERDAAIALQKGELDIVASGMGVVMEMPGADFLGGLPPQVQSYVKFSIGVAAASKQPEAARALQRFLTSPAVAPALKAKGMERD
jgi:molybdate transport system substrate-binding protein